MIYALERHQNNRSRTDPVILRSRLANARAGMNRLKRSGLLAQPTGGDSVVKKLYSSDHGSAGIIVRSDEASTRLDTMTIVQQSVIDLTGEDSDSESPSGRTCISKSSSTELMFPETMGESIFVHQEPPARVMSVPVHESSSGPRKAMNNLPQNEEELDQVLANIKVAVRVGCFTLDSTLISLKGCYRVETLFCLIEGRLSGYAQWRGKVVRGMSVWLAVDRKYSFGRGDEIGYQSMVRAVIGEGTKKTVVDVDYQEV